MGPLVAPVFMSRFPGRGFFAYIISASIGLSIYGLYRRTRRKGLPPEEQSDFIMVAQTSVQVGELDDRLEEKTN